MGQTVFSRRSMGYKTGLIQLMLGLVLYVLGFASPYWYKLVTGVVYVHGGLWQTCVQIPMIRLCSHTPVGHMPGNPVWLTVVKGLECVVLAILIVTCLYGVVVNWILRNPKHCRLLEIASLTASTMGVAASLLFIVKTERNSDDLKRLTSLVDLMGIPIRHTVAWALGLNLAACIICLVASIIIALNNSEVPPADPPGFSGYTDPETGAVYPVVDAANQEVYYISQPPMMPGFQPMGHPYQPPAYETAIATPYYPAPPYSWEIPK